VRPRHVFFGSPTLKLDTDVVYSCAVFSSTGRYKAEGVETRPTLFIQRLLWGSLFSTVSKPQPLLIFYPRDLSANQSRRCFHSPRPLSLVLADWKATEAYTNITALRHTSVDFAACWHDSSGLQISSDAKRRLRLCLE